MTHPKTNARIVNTMKLHNTHFKKTQLALVVGAFVMGLGGVRAPAFAGPEGGVVTGGSGTIDQSGNTTVINQTTDLLAIDWNSFDVGVNETVQYIQPDASSVSLNRILSNNGSVIQGQIDANGQVILVNPHGVIFTATSVINAGGILASGLTIDTSEFMNGDFAFEAVEGTDGVVINSGLLNAATGGSVNLLGKKVINEGLIQADLGRVSLAAGNAAVVSFDADGLIGITVTESVLQEELGVDPAILNEGDISAAGGKVLISAAASRDIFSAAVNTDDLRQATSVVMDDDGGFTLSAGANVVNTGNVDVSVQTASNNSTVNNAILNTTAGGTVVILGENIEQSGTVTASSVVGDGGSIEIHSVDTTLIQDGSSLNANSLNADAGDIKVLGNNVGLLADTTVEATGATNGGEVLIGGDYRGENNLIPTATAVYFDREATITANAMESGSAGKVILWGDDSLKAYGDISAAGFGLADGGFVETSSKYVNLDLNVSTFSISQDAGNWLIDPVSLNIVNDSVNPLDSFNGGVFTAGSDSEVTNGSIINALNNSTTVILQTGDGGDGSGDITLEEGADLDFNGIDNSGRTLIFDAHGDININANIYDDDGDGSNDVLNLTFTANSDDVNGGDINIADGVVIDTNGGDFTVTSGVNFTSTGATIDLSSNADSGDISITATGDITAGELNVVNANISSTGGNITLDNASNDFTGTVNLSSAGFATINDIDALTFGDVDIGGDFIVTAGGEGQENIILGNTAVDGNLSITAVSGADINAGTDALLNIGGTSTLVARGDFVTIENTNNIFGGAIIINTSGDADKNVGGRVVLAGTALIIGDTSDTLTLEGISSSGFDGGNAGTITITTGSLTTNGEITASGGLNGGNSADIIIKDIDYIDVSNQGTNEGSFIFADGSSWSGTSFTINGGGGNDTFTFNADMSGNSFAVRGNAGNDTITFNADMVGENFTLDAGNGNDTIYLNANIAGADLFGGIGNDIFAIGSINAAASIRGGNGTDEVTSTVATGINNWQITDANLGSLSNSGDTAETEFLNIENLTGSTGDDTFTIATAGSITGTISGTSSTTDTTGNDILVGKDNENIWNIDSANGGSLADENNTAYVTNFSNIDALIGGTDSDTFILNSADTNISLDGGGSTDIVRIDYDGEATWTLDGIDEKVVSTNGSEVKLRNIETAEGSDTAKDTFNISSSTTSFTSLNGRGGDEDTLNLSSIDNEVTWTLNADSQTVAVSGNSIVFEFIENLIGSNTQADTFNYTVNPTHTITAGDGEDIIDVLSVAGFDGVATISVDDNGIERYIGNQNGLDSAEGNSTTLIFSSNTDEGVNWLVYAFDTSVDGVDGINDGDINRTIQFVNVNNLTGGEGNDTFDFTDENFRITGTIDGDLGSNTLNAKDVATEWNIDVADGGTIDTGPVDMFLNTFENIQTINAENTTADTFNVSAEFNTINGDVNDFLIINADNEVWSLTGAGAGSTTTLDNFTGITNLTGNGDNNTLIGIAQDNTWTINEANGGIVEGTSAENSFTFSGMENLAGNTGNDDFTITTAGSITGTLSGTHSNFADAGTDTLTIDSNTAESITWTLTATGGSATTGVDSFDTFEAYIGGAGVDVFELTVDSLSSILDGGDGTADIVRITHGTDAAWSLNDATEIDVTETVTSAGNIVTLNNIEIAEGSESAVDTFTILSDATHFDILRGRGEDDIFIVETAALPIITLDGGGSGGGLLDLSAVDSVLTWALGATQTVTAASGANSITFADIQSLTGSTSSVDNFNYSIAPVHTIDAGESNGIIDVLSVAGVSGVAEITASNNSIERYVGNQDGLDPLNTNSTTLTFLSDEDTDVTWNIKDFDGTATVADGINDGDINDTIQFVNVNNLTGDDGNDAFVFDDTVTTTSGVVGLSGTINGGAGNNSLTAANVVNTWVINNGADNGTLTYLNGFSAGLETTTSFANVGTLNSGDQNDTFTLNDATATLILNAGGGTDNVTLPIGNVNITLGEGVNRISLNEFEIITADADSNNSFTVISEADDEVEWDITGTNSGNVIVGGESTEFNNFQTLIGSLGNDNFDFSSSLGSILTGIDGGDGTNSIVGANELTDWNITRIDGGTTNRTGNTDTFLASFDNIDTINTGSLTDIITVSAAFNTINGDAFDTLTSSVDNSVWRLLSDVAGSIDSLVSSFTGITNLGSTGSGDTLIGIAQDNTWVITGANSGSVTQTVEGTTPSNEFTFTGMENVAGNTGSDVFTIENDLDVDGSISGSLVGMYSGLTDADTGIDTLIIESDTAESVIWNLTATESSTTGRVATFSGFEAYVGGNGADTFELIDSSLQITLDGASGNDTARVAHGVSTEWMLGTATETITSGGNIVSLSNIESGEGSNEASDTFTISSVTDFTSLSGRGADDDFVITSSVLSDIQLIGGGDANDSLSFFNVNNTVTWSLDDLSQTVQADSGTVTFEGIGSLIGSNTGVDTFNYSIMPTHSIDAGANDGDVYNVENVSGNIAITIGADGVAGIERYIGNQDGLTDLATNSTTLTFQSVAAENVDWNIHDIDGAALSVTDGINDGSISSNLSTGGAIEFVNVNNLTGGAGNDTFTLDQTVTASTGVVGLSGLILGGAGSNTFVAANVQNDFAINADGTGSVTYNNGLNDAVTAAQSTTSFSGLNTLISGNGNDTFTLASTAPTLTLNAGAGIDNIILPAAAVDITLGALIDGIALIGFEIITANDLFANSFTVTSTTDDSVDWDITGDDTGSVSINDGTATQFVNFQTLNGSGGDDNFNFTNANSMVTAIDGSTGVNSITGSNVDTEWTINRDNGGLTDTFVTSFDNIQTINTGLAIDTLTVSAVFNTINGDELDTLTSSVDNSVWRLLSDVAGSIDSLVSSFTGITKLDSTGSGDTLIGIAQDNTWLITGTDSGSVTQTVEETATPSNIFTFTGMENITGNVNADTFTINDTGSITGTIDGFSNSNNTLQGRVSTNTTWDLADNQLLNSDNDSEYVSDFTNIQTLVGRATTDRIQTTGSALTNIWTISEATGGNINGLNFSGFDRLSGNGNTDTFNITANNNLTIFGNNGIDIFNIGANSGSLNGGNQDDIFIVTDLAISADLNGNNDNDILTLTVETGSTQNTATWVIDDGVNGSSLNEIITFSGFETFNGDLGIDNFNVARGSDLLTINGGGGTDTLTLASNAGDDTVWNITGENSGTVSTGVDNFISIENITAGAGDDEVIVAVEGSLSGLFDAGESDNDFDTLNLTAFVDGIVVELGAGVNDVIFDPEINVATRINVDNFEEITAADHSPIEDENNNWLAIRHSDNVRFDISTVNEGSVFEADANGEDITSSETVFVNFGSFQGGSGSVESNIIPGGNISGEYREGTGMLNLNYSALDDDITILVDITGNLESVTGNNNVLLRAASDDGFTGDNTWTIYAENAGTFVSVFEDEAFELSFSGVNQLQGGTGNDTFMFVDMLMDNGTTTFGDLTNGSIYGGGGNGVDTIMSTATTALTFGINQLVSTDVNVPRTGDNISIDALANRDGVIDILGITELIGNTADGVNTQLMSADSGDFTWNILAADNNSIVFNDGTTNDVVSIEFSNIDTVAGGEANDTFVVSSLDTVSNIYDGGGGTDELDLSAISGDLALSLDDSIIGADVILAGVETLTLSAANNSLYGLNGVNTWTLTNENTGTLAYFNESNTEQELNFSHVAHLIGNAEQDNFIFDTNGSLTGSINGGSGEFDNILVNTSLNMNFQLSDVDGNGNVIFSDDIRFGEDAVDFVNVESIVANGTGDYSLLGAASVANTWALTSAGNTLTSFSAAGEEKTVTFSGINNLYGGAAQDIFTLDGVSVTGIIDGGSNLANVGADDTLTLLNLEESIVHIGDRVTEDMNVVNIESITDESESGTLRGDDIANIWNINRIDGGVLNDAIAFTGFTALVGGSDTDVFDITVANSMISSLDGGAAPTTGNIFDSLTFDDLLDAVSMVVSLDASYEDADIYIANIDDITGSALTNTLVGTAETNDWLIEDNDSGNINGVSFTGFGNFIGRNGVDTFTFLELGTVSGFIDGGAQPEGTFDTVDLSELTSTINVVIGNTESGFSNIEQYIGNNSDAQFTAADFANTWTIDGENSGSLSYTDSDSSVNTILFSDFDILTGGSSSDEFTLENLGSVTGSILGGAGNDALFLDLASGRDGEVAFNGGEGNNTITLTGGSNAERFDADYQPLSDGSALLDFTRESSTFSVDYNNVATLNNEVFIQTLTVAPVVSADNTITLSGNDSVDIAIIDNTNNITHTVVSNSETNSMIIDGDASDTVVIDGAVELANTLTLNDVLIDFDEQSSIQANTLIFDRTGSIGSAEQRLTTDIQTLELITVNGDTYLDNNGDLEIAALTSPVGVVDLFAGGNVTGSTALTSSNSLIIGSTSDIVLDAENNLTGDVSLSATNGGIVFNNGVTNLAGIEAVTFDLTARGNVDSSGPIMVADLITLTGTDTSDFVFDQADNDLSRVELVSGRNVTLTNNSNSELSVVGTTSGVVEIATNASLSLDNLTADSVLADAAGSIDLDEVNTVSAISLNSSQDIVLDNISASNINVTAIDDLTFNGDVTIIDSTTDTVKAFTAQAGGAFIVNAGADISSVAGSSAFGFDVASNTVSLAGTINALDADAEFDFASSANVSNTQRFGTLTFGVEEASSVGQVTMTSSGEFTSVGDLNLASDGNLLLSHVMSDATVTLSVNGQVIDNNNTEVNITANELVSHSTTGFGTSEDNIETSVAHLSVVNLTNDIAILNDQALSVDALINQGDILLRNTSGTVTINNDNDAEDYIKELTGTEAALGVIDGGYNTGFVSIFVDDGALVGAGDVNPDRPDLVAFTANVATTEGFGEAGRPLVLWINESITVEGNGFLPIWFENDVAEFLTTGDFIDTSFAVSSADLLIEIESIDEVDPAIFNNVLNYEYGELSIRLPSDQLFEDYDDEDDEDEDNWVSGI